MTRNTLKRRRYLLGLTSVLAGAGCLSNDGETGRTTRPFGETEALAPSTTVTSDSLQTPIRGDPEADVTVSTYEDFACPHCREYSLSVAPEVVETFAEPGSIRYERYDFPIPVHEQWSWAAANAARAVQADGGMDAFWEYTDLLYESQGNYSADLFPDLAEEVEADAELVRRAVRDDVYRPVLKADRQRGLDRGVTGTPTIFVNGRSVDAEFGKIRSAIEGELESSG